MKTAIVIGNGFDLDLGWKTSYEDFYKAHDGWRMHQNEKDNLFQYVIKHAAENWFDFERTIYDYVIRKSKDGEEDYIISRDLDDYRNFKKQLKNFLSRRSCDPINKSSFAYNLVNAYIDKCKRYNTSSLEFIKFFSFNYTPLINVAQIIDPEFKFSYIPVHGTIENDNIIFGVHNDSNISRPYRDIQKSMDDKYESHGIVSSLMEANLIIFFGLSMGFIDAVYFKDFFEQVSKVTNANAINKEFVFITKDAGTFKDIKNNLQDMGIDTQVLFNTNTLKYIYTVPPENEKIVNRNKFHELLSKL